MKSLFILLLLLVFAIQGCGSKEESLLPAKSSNNSGLPNGNDRENDEFQNLRDSSPSEQEILGALPDNSPALQNSLEKNLNTFFSTFVVRKKAIKYAYDSEVDYQNLHRLLKGKDKKLLTLLALIEKQFANRNALENKSNNYKKAFYINAYNYFSIRTILKGYIKNGRPIESIKELNSGINDNVYDRDYSNFLIVAGQSLSLNGIIANLRTLTGKADPRIGFALNGGAKGYPPLLYEAYGEKVLDDQLDFVTHYGFKLERIFKVEGTSLWLGFLFSMSHYGEEIRSSAGTLKEFLEKHQKAHGQVVRGKIKMRRLDFQLNSLSSERGAPSIDIQINPGDDNVDLGDSGSGSGSDGDGMSDDIDGDDLIPNIPEGPCSMLQAAKGYKPVYSCTKVEDGKYTNGLTLKKSKYVVTKADLCVLQKASSESGKKALFKVVGSIEDIDPKEGAKKEVLLDISSDSKLKKKIEIEESAPGIYTLIWLYKDKKIEADRVMDIRQKEKKGKTRRNERRALISCDAI